MPLSDGLVALLATAATLAFVHTLAGPDHYVPFVAMARVGRWSRTKTLVVTVLCGVGHVLSSVVLGFAGIGLATGVERLVGIESTRGDLAAWLLIAFGLVYGVWGLRAARRGHRHTHVHVHEDGTVHEHDHDHRAQHVHVHEERKSLTPWILFVIFLLGPCEPLIPLLMFPALEHSMSGVALVATVFGVITIATMTLVVLALLRGLELVRFDRLERYTHALGGAAILLCGVSVKFLGL